MRMFYTSYELTGCKVRGNIMNLPMPRLCVVGNLLGRNEGYITTQGLILADLFANAGYSVRSCSSRINRLVRLCDIAKTIIACKNRTDVIILDVYSGQSMIIADTVSTICKLLKIPLIAVLRGGNLPQFVEKYPQWTQRILRRADILVAPSHFLAKEFEKYDFSVRVIPNVIDIDLYPFKPRSQISSRLIWMRSFHPIYNPQMALDVLARLRSANMPTTLTMAGADKGLESEIKKRTEEMGLSSSVRFPGFLTSEAKAREFANADIYINTNHIDNMPVSVVEACAFGLPVVATRVGGISHLLSHGENGILVKDGDADEMASAITNLLSNKDLTEKLSNGGRRLAEQSAWPSVRSKWNVLFEELGAGEKIVNVGSD